MKDCEWKRAAELRDHGSTAWNKPKGMIMFRRHRRIEDLPGVEAARQSIQHLVNTWPIALELEYPSEGGPGSRGLEPEDAWSLPPDLQLSADRKVAGQMVLHPGHIVIDGSVRTCPQCQVDRDWLVLYSAGKIFLRCRSGHETFEPALSHAWFQQNSGPVQESFPNKEAGIRSNGYDGTFSGITF